MIQLGVNIDHVATLRQARYARDPENFNREPSILEAAEASIAGGADSITVHPRADGRHMQVADVRLLRARLAVPLNMEMGATEAMLRLALEERPAFVCIVPETREEVTTEGGLDAVAARDILAEMIPELQGAGIKVSLFIDPVPAQVEVAAALKADMIELHTGCFANARGGERAAEVARLADSARLAHGAGLQVNAGHGITLANLPDLFAIPHLAELNIGHSIVSRAVFIGITAAVAEMRAAMNVYRG
ncbi:MAG: pyridoxine 5'-phosphate synthase [Verrucomicrobiales bacterium]